MLPWAEVCANRHLKNLPYKIETNRFGKIVMSARTLQDGARKSVLGSLLSECQPGGEIIAGCAIETSDGTRVADVVWVSRARFASHRESASLPFAPEICIEILSNSNTREEMLGKMQLYFAAGAQEVWLCDEDGVMEFFLSEQVASVPASRLCAGFPLKLKVD